MTISANVKSGNTCDRNPLNDSITPVVPITCSSSPIADLAITKKHEPEILAPGQAITYVLTVRNNGPSDVPSATVTDLLPPIYSARGAPAGTRRAARSPATPSPSQRAL